jgi:hypothetical protein
MIIFNHDIQMVGSRLGAVHGRQLQSQYPGQQQPASRKLDYLLLWPVSMWVTRCSPGRSMTTALCAAYAAQAPSPDQSARLAPYLSNRPACYLRTDQTHCLKECSWAVEGDTAGRMLCVLHCHHPQAAAAKQ